MNKKIQQARPRYDQVAVAMELPHRSFFQRLPSKLMIPKRCSIWLISILGVVAKCDAAECVHEIIPSHWITSDGTGETEEERSEIGYIFPSWLDYLPSKSGRRNQKGESTKTTPYTWHGESSAPAHYEADNFLKKGNRIPTASFCLECGKTCRVAGHSHKIEIKRANNGPHLIFDCCAATVQEIRKRPFGDFQALQHDFEKWLLHQADPVYCLSGLFVKARDRFDRFDYHLRTFWTNVLETAKLSKPKNMEAIGEPVPVQISKSETGMDSVLMVPGLRLKINWGGVVLIPQGPVNNTSISRQTITGSTEVDVVESSEGIRLFPTPPRMHNVTSESFQKIGTEAETEFGRRAELKEWYFNRIIPVYNDNDLRNIEAFKRFGHEKEIAKKLILFTPRTYPKADKIGEPTEDVIKPLTAPSRGLGHDPEDAFLNCSIIVGTNKDVTDTTIWPRTLWKMRGQIPASKAHLNDTSAIRIFGNLEGDFTGMFEGRMEINSMRHSISILKYFRGTIEEGKENSPSVLIGRFFGSASGKFFGAFSGKRSGEFQDVGLKNYPEFRAMIFANQSTIYVQVPLTINGIAAAPFPPLGTTVWNVLETRAQRVFGREDSCTPGAPLLSLTRTRSAEGHFKNRNSGVYRFFCLPKLPLQSITITPADSFAIPQ